MPIFKVSLAAARRILKLGTLRVPVFNIQGSKEHNRFASFQDVITDRRFKK